MSLLAQELGIQWLHVSFSETGNGKGENDGQGFWLKNQWHNKERMRQKRMEDAWDCFTGTEDFDKQPSDPASNEPRPYGTVHRREFVFLVDKSQLDEKYDGKDVIFTDFAGNKINCTPVPGIQSTHEWLLSCNWTPGTLWTRQRHCACPSCRDHNYGPATACQQKPEMQWKEHKLALIVDPDVADAVAVAEEADPAADGMPRVKARAAPKAGAHTQKYLTALWKDLNPFGDQNPNDKCIIVAVPNGNDFYLGVLVKKPRRAKKNEQREWACLALNAYFKNEANDPQLDLWILVKHPTREANGDPVTKFQTRTEQDKDCLLGTNLFFWPRTDPVVVPTGDVLQIPSDWKADKGQYIKAKWFYDEGDTGTFTYQIDLQDLAKVRLACETQELNRGLIHDRE